MANSTKLATMIADTAVKAMEDKKAKQIVKIDLTGIESSVADYFVICHGDSDTQVKAIANNVEDEIRETLSEKVHSREGESLGRWVLLDYVNVVVHVFLREVREFYEIEELWHDGEFTHYEDVY